ncbi:hypothetical protein [Thermochromatium tepidum]|uniref:Uncharacterized protein n=1 Tax=Thermochromatium tepidum ATCC 43061 TaxID=316276 RepID=A0A6I6DX57_THETI|nr:hypothetical protein [Thermochromatium tepidum]QGU32131.1 hypothetical protein E6P07_03485 [Thermochromatium tepidum ATCC 43061]
MRLTEIQPGMRLAKDVHDPQGRILIRAGVVLSERQIRLLRSWAVADVCIARDEEAGDLGRRHPEISDELLRSIDTQFSLSNRDHPVIQALQAFCLSRMLERRQG